MRTSSQIRSITLVTVGLASVLSFTAPARAQATKFVGRFATTTIGLNPGGAVATKIDVLRWSTDEEAGSLTDAFKKDPAKWVEALQAAPSVGYIWTASSSLGYSVKLARRVPTAGGGARIVLAVDRVLGSWERTPWKATVGSTDYPFTVLELRVNAQGIGVGKGSLAGKIVADDALKSVGAVA